MKTGIIRAVVEGFRIQLLHTYIKYNKGSFGPLRNEELLRDYHQFL